MELTELRTLQLVQTGRTLLKISSVYDRYCTAEVVYENGARPGRTTVRSYTAAEIAQFQEPTKGLLGRYDATWGRK